MSWDRAGRLGWVFPELFFPESRSQFADPVRWVGTQPLQPIDQEPGRDRAPRLPFVPQPFLTVESFRCGFTGQIFPPESSHQVTRPVSNRSRG